MTEQNTSPQGPDLSRGVELSSFVDGKLVGHVNDHEVLLVQGKNGVFAVDAHCSHYHAPLSEGLVTGDIIRCPWHHACFDLQNGDASRAPAIDALACWKVELRNGSIFVREKYPSAAPVYNEPERSPDCIVIIGGGAAGFAAAEMLRRRQYQGDVIMLSADDTAPVDRPNLSKDFLAGNAPEEWIPLRPASFYDEHDIELRLNTHASDIDAEAREVVTDDGGRIPYDRLLLATGSEPVRLSIPGANQRNVFTLRTFADCQAIIAAASGARRAIIIGASFIGLEAAAALRAREIEVHVVAPEEKPMARILGPDMGNFIQDLHERHGVIFHLQDTATEISGSRVTLESGTVLIADFLVAGIGVRPRLALAETAGIALDRGIIVDSFLETSAAGVYAAGDIVRWPDRRSGTNIRVEHWVVAQRQGQTAALNMLGLRETFDAVPFFWSQHYDVPINYVGHAEEWDEISIDGDIASMDCMLKYMHKGKVLAGASIFRDIDSLRTEIAMEQDLAS